MSEELEGAASASAEPQSAGVAADPAAMALALGSASREKADAFLDDQRRLAVEQLHHLREQFKQLAEQLKQLRLQVWEKRLGVLLRIATAFVGIVVAAGLAYLVWIAANSNNLVIDSFAVPPDLAARGLSGPVVAAKLSDKIAAMQSETGSLRPPKSYANGLADGLKLEIPETGVSLSELDRFLREKLGHDLHIGGETVQTDSGVSLTARVGSDGSATVTGTDADMDNLMQKLAEQVYRITQPYRYGSWARSHRRLAEALASDRELATRGPDSERPWGYLGWAQDTQLLQSVYAALALLQRGQALDAKSYLITTQIATLEYCLGRVQDSQRDFGTGLAVLLAHGRDYTLPDQLEGPERTYRAMGYLYQGALPETTQEIRKVIRLGVPGLISDRGILALALAGMHEPDSARAALAGNLSTGRTQLTFLHARLAVELEARNWPGVLIAEAALPRVLALYPGFADTRLSLFNPLSALALAHMGQFAAAEARLKATPADCYPCLRARAQVAALERQDGRADFWFGRATAIGPSIPYAESEWGKALLDRGQPDNAIVKFKLANQKGPHFADPLEGWSEALMAKDRSHLALTKFREADKYAPNWGRLHLKWGEALFYAGKKDEAKAEFARAAQLDLTPSEKAELAGMNHG